MCPTSGQNPKTSANRKKLNLPVNLYVVSASDHYREPKNYSVKGRFEITKGWIELTMKATQENFVSDYMISKTLEVKTKSKIIWNN